jgi:protein ATS1
VKILQIDIDQDCCPASCSLPAAELAAAVFGASRITHFSTPTPWYPCMDPPTLLAAGSNGRGQLAIGHSRDAHSFTPCKLARSESSTSPPAIISIVGGGNHTLALLSWAKDSATSLEVWGCGEGAKGQLGLWLNADSEGRDESAVLRPLILPWEEQGLFGYTIAHVAACWETSFFVLNKHGQHDLLASMGGNDFGDLGIGDLPSKKKIKAPFHIVDLSHIVGSTAQRISITDITAGPHHVIVLLRADKKQYIAGWGTARHGQLGPLLMPSGRALPFSPSPVAIDLPIDVQLDPVLSVRAGNQHSVFLHASGHVSALGSDAKGQLQGVRRTAEDVQAIDCTWNGTYIRTPLGLLSTGSNARGQLGRRENASIAPSEVVRFPMEARVLDLACGSEHVLAVVESRGRMAVWGWGWNEHGNLGTGSLDDVTVPVQIWPPPAVESEAMTSIEVRVWAGCGTSWIAVFKCAKPMSRLGDAGHEAQT